MRNDAVGNSPPSSRAESAQRRGTEFLVREPGNNVLLKKPLMK
jgi:hypothetical protein